MISNVVINTISTKHIKIVAYDWGMEGAGRGREWEWNRGIKGKVNNIERCFVQTTEYAP